MSSVRIDWGPAGASAWLSRCLTSGARALDDTEATMRGFEPGAVIPTEPEPATLDVLERYAADATTPTHLTVQFTQPPADTLKALHPLEPAGRGYEFWLLPGVAAMFNNIDEFTPGELTTTLNGNAQARTENGAPLAGLHIDSVFANMTDDQGRMPRRLGACLGPGDHYLVLGFAEEFEQATSQLYTDNVREYVAAGGDLTCLWLRLTPGDAYIAPVCDVPHVGSAWQVPQASSMAFLSGHWPHEAFEPMTPGRNNLGAATLETISS
jgi:hypothetical protein